MHLLLSRHPSQESESNNDGFEPAGRDGGDGPPYRGTWLRINTPILGPCSRTIPRVL